MSNRHALLIGVDLYAQSEHTNGARADVRDLWKTLQSMGYNPDNIRVLTTPLLTPEELESADPAQLGEADSQSIRDGLAWLAQRQTGENPTAFVHISARGVTREVVGQAICASDVDLAAGTGLVALHDVVAPFADRPVRSLFVSVDAGFAGTGRSFGATVDIPPSIDSGDAVLMAGGHRGHVGSHHIGGELRGALSWSLCRVLESMSPTIPWTFDHLLSRVKQAHSLFRLAQAPDMLPMKTAGAMLGAMLEEQPWGVPWRGVTAYFQWNEEHTGIVLAGTSTQIGAMIAGPSGTQQDWIWFSDEWTSQGFDLDVQDPGPPPTGGTTQSFENNAFSSYGGSQPNVSAADRSFQVTIPSGHDTWLIVRNVANPTRLEWYSTFGGAHFDLQVGEVLTFTQQSISNWADKTWQSAIDPEI